MKQFYGDTLGLTVEADRGKLVALKGAGGAEIVLHAGRDGGPSSGRPHWLLQILVEDIDATVEELRTRGVQVEDVEDRPYGRYARFEDPEGNRLGLEQA